MVSFFLSFRKHRVFERKKIRKITFYFAKKIGGRPIVADNLHIYGDVRLVT